MNYQLLLLILVGIVDWSSADENATKHGCPDDTWFYSYPKNGTRRCYKVYQASGRPDRCHLIDYCRPLHPDAIPATLSTVADAEDMKNLDILDWHDGILIGAYIPCGGPNNFINVDGTPLAEKLMVMNDDDDPEYFAMIIHTRTDDFNPDRASWDYQNRVLCAMAPKKTFSDDKCPDDSYIYREINGVGHCFKRYRTPNTVDQCNVINACRSLDPKAIPVTLTSIEQRDYLKTLVDPSVYTLIGVSIPCGHPYNVKAYKNIDGTRLPAPLEVTTGMWPNQVLGMLFENKTDNLDPQDPYFFGDVLCNIPVYFGCPPGSYPDSIDGKMTADTNCVHYVPYDPSKTPEEICGGLNSDSTYQPPSTIECKSPQTVVYDPPEPLPWCPK